MDRGTWGAIVHGAENVIERSEGFPGGSAGKESTCNAGDLGSVPELGRSPGEGNGSPLQYSGLENSRTEELDTTERLTHTVSEIVK